jgi:hypothetical protein
MTERFTSMYETDYIGHGMRQLVACLSLWKPGILPGSLHVGFVGKAVMGQVSLRVGFPLSVTSHSRSPLSNITWRINKRPIRGHSSETLSDPTDVNNNNNNNNNN